MKINHILILILLSIISGSSFIFTKNLAPAIGPILTTELRILIASVFLIIYSVITKFDIEWRKYWKLYLIIGVLNSAIPFLLYSYAALYINASYLAIFNSTAPLFAAVFAIIWLKQTLTFTKLIGLLLGIAGVTIITFNALGSNHNELYYVGAILCITAAAFYALSGIYIKIVAKEIKPLALATGSQMMASLILAPFIIFDTVEIAIVTNNIFNFDIIINILMLSVVCSAIAYLIYFKLINEIGPIKTLTVTFLSPFVAMILDYIFLNGQFTELMLVGAIIIIIAIMISNEILFSKKKQMKFS